jgi:hypothetical protein
MMAEVSLLSLWTIAIAISATAACKNRHDHLTQLIPDWLMRMRCRRASNVTEANEAESVIAALLAPAAAGMISDVTTSRAWTAEEFKAIADKGSKVASFYQPPKG